MMLAEGAQPQEQPLDGSGHDGRRSRASKLVAEARIAGAAVR